jgi:glycosyltransferase involved in cell wall biosynthesis
VAVAPKMSNTEGNGKISNYMAMGLPVVAFDTPVNRELLGDLGIYARFGDVEDLADKLFVALEKPGLAAHTGAAVREHAVAHLSWDAGARQIERIYAQVLAARGQKAVAVEEEGPAQGKRERGGAEGRSPLAPP